MSLYQGPDGEYYTLVAVYTRESSYIKKIKKKYSEKKIRHILVELPEGIAIYVLELDLIQYIRGSRKYRGMDYMKGVFYATHKLLDEKGYLSNTDGSVVRM